MSDTFTGRDWSREELIRRSAPFASMLLLAFATLPIVGENEYPELLWIAFGLAVALIMAVIFAPWERLPRAASVTPPFIGLVIVALLRHAEGGGTSGYSVLALVPVLWLALFGTRRELLLMLVAVAAFFLVPILVFGATGGYPEDEWRRAILTVAVGAFIGLVTQNLVAQSRLRAEEAERTAGREREREAYLRTVMNSASDGIVAIDEKGCLTFVNPAAASMLGYSVDELVGQMMHDRLHHSYPDGRPYPIEECPIMDTLASGREAIVADEVFWGKYGAPLPVEYGATAMLDDGEITGAVVIFADISERLAIEQMKNEFISVVSHELRTPLISIRGSLGLLEGGVLGELSSDAKEMLAIAISNADRLVRLINDILDIERIESGKAPMEMRACELAELVESTRALLAISADEAGVKLVVEPVQARLEADPDRIVQALVNLIGNAIKFSPKGGTVTIGGAVRDRRVRVFVRDQGPGIPPEQRETIFDRFAQVDSADARQEGGSGLGLAIARGIVEQHGGRVWVESTGSEGSTFALEIPAERAAPSGEEPQPEGDGLDALVVEDDADLARVLVTSMRKHGVRATHVSDVEDALHVLRERSPEVIVLDLILPDRKGETVIDWLKQENRLGESAIVVYTARNLDPGELAELRTVAEVITKSRVTPKEFEARLMATIEQNRRRDD